MIENISNKVGGIFSTKPKNTNTVNNPSVSAENSDMLQKGETYEHWGIRICGQVCGSLPALPSSLQRVYGYMHKQQSENKEYQEQAKRNTQAQIDQKNEEINDLNNKINKCEECISEYKEKTSELKQEKQELKKTKEQVQNREQRLKLIIGLVIIIPLTVYLFLFYSSTFYAAFFRNTENVTDVMTAMFDPKALKAAADNGPLELCLLLTAPTIFMGLGFCLHFFAVQKERIRFIKMGAILLITVTFDCILAFLIGKQLHAYGQIIGTVSLEKGYTIELAVTDLNTWAVIFCGFIVYVIWGIVFDMCMTAYNKMDWNKTRLEEIKEEITTLEQNIKEVKYKIEKYESEIKSTKGEIKVLMTQLGNQIYIDYSAIKTEMTNFFNGWLQQMQLLKCQPEIMEQANNVFKENVSTLIPNK